MRNTKTPPTPRAGRGLALAFATVLLAANFWAWSLISPLASQYANELSLQPFLVSSLIAAPVIIGSLGRIMIGALTDRYGGKIMFVAITFLAIVPVMGLSVAHGYNQLLLIAFLLGITGASFAAGVPFVNAWYPARSRGFALGVYGMGNLGVAVSGFLTPRLAAAYGRPAAYYLVASLLFVLAAAAIFYLRESPDWRPSAVPFGQRFAAAARFRPGWDLSLLYMLTFGAFVALGVYLPTLLSNYYDLSLTDAAYRAAGFVLLATTARPLGGWLSDRIGAPTVIRLVLLTTAGLACVASLQPNLNPLTTSCYLGMAFTLGCGNGAVFALVSKLSPPELLGSITGIVGAVGGLGGFFPPLLLGAVYQATHSYRLALLLLAMAAGIMFVYINSRFKIMRTRREN